MPPFCLFRRTGWLGPLRATGLCTAAFSRLRWEVTSCGFPMGEFAPSWSRGPGRLPKIPLRPAEIHHRSLQAHLSRSSPIAFAPLKSTSKDFDATFLLVSAGRVARTSVGHWALHCCFFAAAVASHFLWISDGRIRTFLVPWSGASSKDSSSPIRNPPQELASLLVSLFSHRLRPSEIKFEKL